jgi:nonsense-mediated mRNA decay protein 3
MFCVECGREGPTHEGLCGECFLRKHPVVRPPEALDVSVCAHCGRIETDRGWEKVDLEDAIPALLEARIPVDPAAGRHAFTHAVRREDARNLLLTVTLQARVHDLDVVESFRTRLRVKRRVCPTCSRQRGQYFEAILQVRAEGRALAKEERARLLAFVEAAIARRVRKGEALFISKVEDVRGGADVYLSSNSAARTIARELADAVHGAVGASPKIYGRKNGKDLYRVTYVVRVPE